MWFAAKATSSTCASVDSRTEPVSLCGYLFGDNLITRTSGNDGNAILVKKGTGMYQLAGVPSISYGGCRELRCTVISCFYKYLSNISGNWQVDFILAFLQGRRLVWGEGDGVFLRRGAAACRPALQTAALPRAAQGSCSTPMCPHPK